MQRIERVADFVCHAGGKQCQSLHALTFDSGDRLRASLRGIMHDQCDATAATRLSIQWSCVDAEKAGARIMDFQVVTHDKRAAARVTARERLPIEIREPLIYGLPFEPLV